MKFRCVLAFVLALENTGQDYIVVLKPMKCQATLFAWTTLPRVGSLYSFQPIIDAKSPPFSIICFTHFSNILGKR